MENTTPPHNSIKTWAEDDRPREKMINHGPSSLGLHELLAILINNGSKNKSAIDLARDLMQLGGNNLHKMLRLSIPELQRVKGIGPAKAITIKAALELAIRIDAAGLAQKDRINHSGDVANYLRRRLGSEDRELFVVIFLNQSNRIITQEVVSTGGIAGTVVDIRIILRRALENKATSLILCHNHPSGNLNPSNADKTLTQRLKDAGCLLDIKINDHIIVSDEGYYSFADEGNL
jgi:DNA repair protein RadC